MLHAVPCLSKAGAGDPVEKIPARAPGDASVRIGLVHGTTFDLPNCETNFPIRAGIAGSRGLDYLAIGDTHGFRVVQEDPLVVYPGAPEPSAFDEVEPGHVALVCFPRSRGRPLLRKLPVARWKWRRETIRDLDALRGLAAEDLRNTVLRLSFDVEVDLRNEEEVQRTIDDLAGNEARHGRAGVLDVDRTGIRIRTGSLADAFPPDLPPVLRTAVDNLQGIAAGGDPVGARRARLALGQLSRELSRLTGSRSPR